ncbi:hypothetical protein FB45DRAFT_1130215 [Roridomyces roridus]|uniref:beta-glucosidase n=1 Tax=Roridomyces roridus TaxID=1738132 RepID=A0AAD7FAH2_9AGAR|nr:hypothetical protein FB45DRAFT_1130215 [Roridomyces roridus]
MLSPVFLQLLSLVAAVQASYAFTARSWDEASALANATVTQLTLEEKISLVTGVGDMSGELGFYQSVNGNEGDRNDLEVQWEYTNMSAFASNPNITTIVYAGAPGEQTGPGLVDVLTGIFNPSGRLPFSIADVESDYNTTIVTDPGFPLGFPVIEIYLVTLTNVL